MDHCALFLDFDGTLVDIVERPEAVAIDPALPPILTCLQEQLNGALAIISGRPITFLDRAFAPCRFDSAGLHGLEHRIGDKIFLCDPNDHPDLRDMVRRLQDAVLSKPGLLIEDKGCSVALHWRLAPHEKDFARATAQAAVEALGAQYRIQYGKAVAEIAPSGAGKGSIIEQFLQQSPYRGRRPVFVGDDLTDENGFKVVNIRGGLSVRVGAGETVAAQRVGTPSDLRHLLSVWARTGTLSFDGR
ncbi:trehalose-phosphatase [Microvirga sp. c23x22]|uniref:Trehalose 6-phosphate phosphatase n=2 Tax=Microvirga terricola TaxID=2719797 RepID=A0ABX0V5H2_9HYPH|nr:trehalose-phosphatase [Microvirga terricola]